MNLAVKPLLAVLFLTLIVDAAAAEGTLEEGQTVTILVPEPEGSFELTAEQHQELAEALAEADRGEGIDGWQLLAELRQS